MEEIAKATHAQNLDAWGMLPKLPDGSSVHGNKEDAEAFADDMASFAIQEAPPRDEPEPAWAAAMRDHAEKAVSMIREKALGLAKSAYEDMSKENQLRADDMYGAYNGENDEPASMPTHERGRHAEQVLQDYYTRIPRPDHFDEVPFSLPQDSMVLKADLGDRLDKETLDGYISRWTDKAPSPFAERAAARQVEINERDRQEFGDDENVGVVQPHHVADKSLHALSALADAHDEAVKCVKLCKGFQDEDDRYREGLSKEGQLWHDYGMLVLPHPDSDMSIVRDRGEHADRVLDPRQEERSLVFSVAKGPFTPGWDPEDRGAILEHSRAALEAHVDAMEGRMTRDEASKVSAESDKVRDDNRPIGLKALHAMRDHAAACKAMIKSMVGGGSEEREDEIVPFNSSMVPNHSDAYTGKPPSNWYSPVDHSRLEGGDPQATIEVEIPEAVRPSQADTNPGGRSKSLRLHPSEHGHSLKALAKAYREAHKAQAMIEGVIEKAYTSRQEDPINDPKSSEGSQEERWRRETSSDGRLPLAEVPTDEAGRAVPREEWPYMPRGI